MAIECYYLGEKDQAQSSWVLLDLVQKRPKHVPKLELPPTMYQLFGPIREGSMQMKSEYLAVCCKKCGRYSEEDIFALGFREPATIKLKGDYAHTEDRVFVVNDKFLKVIQKAKVEGYQAKAIGKSGWHALLVTTQVDCVQGVMKPKGATCSECGRPDCSAGAFEHVNQFDHPKSDNTFFTTKINFCKRLWDRDIFVTKSVVSALKAAGIKGGYCNRLLTDEEVRTVEEKAKEGKKWKPAGITVML